jgi:hypothetical protein
MLNFRIVNDQQMDGHALIVLRLRRSRALVQ